MSYTEQLFTGNVDLEVQRSRERELHLLPISGAIALRMNFGDRVRSLRLTAGQLPHELASDLGITRAQMEDIENGSEDIDLDLMETVASVFHRTVAELVEEL